MSGHNKWSQIKHRKGAQDAKRGALFTKLLGAIAIAAKSDPRPDTNPRLRSLIEQAQRANVPLDRINRALKRASEQKDLKEFIFECLGPGGIAVLVEGVTDNHNRSLQQLRTLAQDNGGKPADPGSLLWAFTLVTDTLDGVPVRRYQPSFTQPISAEQRAVLEPLIEQLDLFEDTQRVITNADQQT